MMTDKAIHVVKRNGFQQKVDPIKVVRRLQRLAEKEPSLVDSIDVADIAEKTVRGLVSGMSTAELDGLAMNIAAAKTHEDPANSTFAARIAVSNLHKSTPSSFTEISRIHRHHFEPKSGVEAPLLNERVYNIVKRHGKALDAMINHERDYSYDYFGYKTLEQTFLRRINGEVFDRPQYMIMRVALCLHGDDLENVKGTYDLMSEGYFTHATPTLCNAGSTGEQLCSCFLLCNQEDSIDGLFNTFHQMANISKHSGGIGVCYSDVRASNSYVCGTNGVSHGPIPFLKIANETARAVDQGGKRKGSIAPYMEPWHADIFDFLQLKKTGGNENLRCRDLYPGLWIPRLFYDRVEENGTWSLFCPREAPGLSDAWGDTFDALYRRYENTPGLARRVVKAQEVFFAVVETKIETGLPYILSKDECNGKSNQQNLGTIKCSNLCVAPYTRILTENGYIPIGTLEGQSLNVWNGKCWSPVKILRTGLDTPLYRITTASGSVLDCTSYHRFYGWQGQGDPSDLSGCTTYQAKDLCAGMVLPSFDLPVVPGCTSNGLWSPYIAGYEAGITILRSLFRPTDLEYPWDAVPLDNPFRSRRYWFLGVFEAMTGLCSRCDTSVALVCLDVQVVRNTRLFLQTMSIDSTCGPLVGEPLERLRSITLGTVVPGLQCDDRPDPAIRPFALFVERDAVQRLKSFCMMDDQNTEGRVSRLMDKADSIAIEPTPGKTDTVVSVDPLGITSDVFCAKEHGRNALVFEGILTSNCTEIIQYSSPDEISVCTLASVALPKFVRDGAFDFDLLRKVVMVVCYNLNRVIEVNMYPNLGFDNIKTTIPKEILESNDPEVLRDVLYNLERYKSQVDRAELSSRAHRPIGIGVQGLADVFNLLRHPFESAEARRLNRQIFETLYFAALWQSTVLAEQYGPYSSYEGSPLSRGIYQFHMWDDKPSDMWDWDALEERRKRFGVRNSLLIAPMPTKTTSRILGNNECFEPYVNNVYKAKVLAGEHLIVNRSLVKDLKQRGLWTETVRQKILAYRGSVQQIDCIPQDIKQLYKTVWEISQKVIIDMAADRAPFVDQSMSMNLFLSQPNRDSVSSMLLYAIKKGLKTVNYYLHSRGTADPFEVTVPPAFIIDKERQKNNKVPKQPDPPMSEGSLCTMVDGCISCGS